MISRGSSELGPGSAERAVLFVSLPSVMGGSTRSLATVLRLLEGRCRRVVAVPDGTWLGELITDHGLAEEVIRMPGLERARPWRGVSAVSVAAWAGRHRASLCAIHANGLAELNIAAGAALISRRPVTVWVHDWQFTQWSRRLVPMLARVTGATFAAVSEASADELRTAGMVRSSPVTVVPNPIDPADVLAPRDSRADIVTIGYLGAPARYKGFHLLPDIARGLAGEPARLVVFSGPETEMPEVWRALREIDDPAVELAGPRTDVRDAYGECDIVVCPSLEESFGRVAAEAMLNGLPVVASDLPALREVISNAGLIVPRDNAAEAATSLRRLVRDADLRKRLGRRGQEHAQRFAPQAIVDQLAHLYGLDTNPGAVAS